MKIRKDLGCFIEVCMSAKEIDAFNASFPCSDIPSRACYFQFAKRNGDLVDMSYHLLNVDNSNAISALCDDAKKFANL